jgi:hypothetical protein
MESTAATDQVTVAAGSARIDGIVADMPSAAKAVVAVMDRKRGPVLRTVPRTALTDRPEAGPDDQALRLLVRRTAPAARGGARGGAGVGRGRAGHTRAATHRPTGK